MRDLHAAIGNRALTRLVQAKLEIGPVDDPCEHEADRLADRVLRMANASGADDATPPAESPRSGVHAGIPASPSVERYLDAVRGRGEPLPPAERAFFEPRFGHDLGGVRVHTDAGAAASAKELNAIAYTAGRDLVFGQSQYAPETAVGRRLLAHELAHVVQQSTGPPALATSAIQREAAALPDLDYGALAAQIRKAIAGLGTDEEAVYRALQQLERNPDAIRRLREVYQQSYSLDLIEDIHDDFSGGELEYALQLLNLGKPDAAERIEGNPTAVVSVGAAAQRIREAVQGWGTDEEAIYATLLPFGRQTLELENAYFELYREELRARLIDEMSGSELDYALSLLAPKDEPRAIAESLAIQVIDRNFTSADRELALRILRDLLQVHGDRLDFTDEQELVSEIKKRVRISQLMKESQLGLSFDYPENMTAASSCPDFVPGSVVGNARVNRAARRFWGDVVIDPRTIYHFRLTADGMSNAYEALTALFIPQSSICDKTLLHCDYLTTIIQLRAFAETIGVDRFNARVRSGAIEIWLTYYGTDYLIAPAAGRAASAQAMSVQVVRPASENDLVIGDHVIFWNHLAYDALTVGMPGPWRLENAILVDKSSSNEDLYEGHGAPELTPGVIGPGTRDVMLGDLVRVYNGIVRLAMDLVQRAHEGDATAVTDLAVKFPRVRRDDDGDWIYEREDRLAQQRARRPRYELRPLSGVGDPNLIGLRDPDDPSKMGEVKRPIESARGPSPSR